MTPENLTYFKKEVARFADLYEHLVTHWNGQLKHGEKATYPVTIIVSVILHNIAFDGSNCVDYSHNKAMQAVRTNIKMLRYINEYEHHMYMTHYAYDEVSSLFDGIMASEAFE